MDLSKKDREYAQKILKMDQKEFSSLSYVDPHPLEELHDELNSEFTNLSEKLFSGDAEAIEKKLDELEKEMNKLHKRIIDAYNT